MLDYHVSRWGAAERESWKALGVFEWIQHYISNHTMPGVWQSVASFGAAFIALRAAGPRREVIDPRQPNEPLVFAYGANISDFWQVFYGVRGASTFLNAWNTYMQSNFSMLRVEELMGSLAQLEREAGESRSTSFFLLLLVLLICTLIMIIIIIVVVSLLVK